MSILRWLIGGDDQWEPESPEDVVVEEIRWGRETGQPTAEYEQALTDYKAGRSGENALIRVLRGGKARE